MSTSVFVYGSLVSGQSTGLSEHDTTNITLKRLQVDVPLIVEYEARALRERLAAVFAAFVDKPAFEMRLGEARALDRNLDLLVSVVGQHFEPCVVWPARNGRLFRHAWHCLVAPLSGQLRG